MENQLQNSSFKKQYLSIRAPVMEEVYISVEIAVRYAALSLTFVGSGSQ